MTFQKKGLLKSTIQITILSFAGIALNFVSQLIIAYYFGATAERDAYFAAIVIPTYLAAIFTGSLGFIFLPQVIELMNDNIHNARRLINTTLVSTSVMLLFLIFFGVIFSGSILRVTSPGFEKGMIESTKSLFNILLFTTLFSVLTNLISYLYQIKQKFIRPAIAPLLSIPVTIILVVTLNSKIGIMSLAIGTLIGSVISLLFVLPIMFTKEFKFNFYINISDIHFITLLRYSLPLFFGGLVFRSAPVLERMIASTLPLGSISILGYSGQLIKILSTIATSGIAISFFPSMADAWTKDVKLFVHYFNQSIRSILLLTIPIAFSFIFYGNSFIKILFQRGAFTSQDTSAVSDTLAYMTPAFIMLSLGGIMSKVFYISKRTLDLTIIGILELLSYLFLSYFLSQYYGYLGIAMGTSIAYSFFMLIYYFYATAFIIKDYDYKLMFTEIFKITLTALFSFSVGYILFLIIKNQIHEYFALTLSLLFALITDLIILVKIKNTEIISLVNKIKNSKQWKNYKMIFQLWK